MLLLIVAFDVVPDGDRKGRLEGRLLEEDPTSLENNSDAVAGRGPDVIGRGSDVAGR